MCRVHHAKCRAGWITNWNQDCQKKYQQPQICKWYILVAESESESCSVLSDSLPPHGLCSPWNSPGQNTGVGSLSLLQGIFPTQGLNPGLPHCRQILYQLNNQGSEEELKNLWWGWKKRVKSWLKTQHSKYKDHGIWSHHFMSNRRGKGRSSDSLYFLGLQDHCR